MDIFLEDEIVDQQTVKECEQENLDKADQENVLHYDMKDLNVENEMQQHHVPSFLSFPSFSKERNAIIDFFECLPKDEIMHYARITLSCVLIIAAIFVMYFAYLE